MKHIWKKNFADLIELLAFCLSQIVPITFKRYVNKQYNDAKKFNSPSFTINYLGFSNVINIKEIDEWCQQND